MEVIDKEVIPQPVPATPKKKKESSSSSTPKRPHKIELKPKDCPISQVIVYNDCAEITRDIVNELQKGTTEINLVGVTPNMDKNSIRVAGAKGNVTILEVSGNKSFTKESSESSDKTKGILDKIEELEKQKKILLQDLKRIEKENEWIDSWAKNLVKPFQAKKGEIPYDPFSKDALLQIENFLVFFQNRMKDIDKRKEEVNRYVVELEKENEKLRKELNLHSSADVSNKDGIQEIIIIVHCKAPSRLELQVAYIVSGAKWTASYDARVNSGEPKIELSYFGNISNSTKEDWNNTNLVLSTAQPSIAGKPPELMTKIVRMKVHQDFYYRESRKNKAIHAPSMSNVMVQRAVYDAESIHSFGGRGGSTPSAEVLTAQSEEGVTSTTFSIPRKATILSDSVPHKVTIKIIKLPSEYTYTILPKLSPHAYLKASVKNTTKDTPLLPGPLNVFMDSSFVAVSDIPLISPNESLGIYLGIDAGIKFEYQPLKQWKDTQGIISKTNKLNVKFNTIITNNKQKDVKIELFDNLPKSTDSQIKVKLIEPEISEDGKGGVALTAANNIHWKISIGPGEKKEVGFSYTVEYPVDKEIENAF